MKRCSLLMVVCLLLLGPHGAGQVSSQSLTITYLYDNTTTSSNTNPDWDFSCLIQGSGSNVLFDTGAEPDILRANFAALHIDASRINAVVFSHEHADHVKESRPATLLLSAPLRPSSWASQDFY